MNLPTLVARGARPGLLTLLLVLVTSPLRPADEPAPKDHSIFVGLDLSVGWKGKYYRVIGAEKNALRIVRDHQDTILPMAVARDIRIKRGVKLSNLSATVANLRGVKGRDRAQAAAEADARRSSEAMQSMMEQKLDSAASNLAYIAGISSPGTDGSAANLGAEITAQTIAPLAEASHSLDRLAQAGNDMHQAESLDGGDLSATGFVVSFEASAPGPLPECHVVIVGSYTLPGGSGATLNKISVQPLGRLDQQARKVTCELRGFPVGAQLQGYRVALYSGGQEVATNLSARRTEITRDEAVLFLITDYLAQHPGETLPPAPILMVPRLEFLVQLGTAPLDQIIYARVDKDGKILRLSTDATGAVRLPSDLSPAVGQIAFVPALDKGKPVEGVARVRLADLAASN